MSAVVESVTTQSSAEGAVSIAKPSGLAVGDFLIAVLACSEVNSISTPAGWTATSAFVTGGDVDIDGYMFYKEADASDVAASNFSFDVADGTGEICGVLMRVSGVRADTPYQGLGDGFDTDESIPLAGSGGSNITPDQANSLIIAVVMSTGITSSSPVINGTNLTWTERFDESETSTGDTIAVYTGLQAVAAEISSISFTRDTGTITRAHATILVFRSREDVSLSPSVIDVAATVQEPAIAAGADVTPSAIDVVASVQAPTITTPEAEWVNQDKSSSTWTNPDKS